MIDTPKGGAKKKSQSSSADIPKFMSPEFIRSKGYYDIDIDLKGVPSTWDIEEVFYIKDLKQRKLFINDVIIQTTTSDIVRHIMQFNKEDMGIAPEERKPIILYLTTNGGSVEAGFQLIDIMLSSKTPVYTVNSGYWYSMGLLIGLAGHKRFATKNARFLMHDGSNFVVDSGAKVQDQVDFQKRMNKRIKDYIVGRSKIGADEYDNKFRVEWYMFADEAKEKGLINYIIGEDCPIDEIV